LILTNLETTFRGITVAAGYQTTVALVENPGRAHDHVPPSDRPYIGMMEGEETLDDFPGVMEVDPFEILVMAVVNGADRAATRTAIQLIAYDIKRALMEDVTRGANPDGITGERNAITTRIKRRRVEPFTDVTTGVLLLGLEVKYRETFRGV
jgi:hypothetical protein